MTLRHPRRWDLLASGVLAGPNPDLPHPHLIRRDLRHRLRDQSPPKPNSLIILVLVLALVPLSSTQDEGGLLHQLRDLLTFSTVVNLDQPLQIIHPHPRLLAINPLKVTVTLF